MQLKVLMEIILLNKQMTVKEAILKSREDCCKNNNIPFDEHTQDEE